MTDPGGFTVVGETLIDLIARPGLAEPARHLGGSPANVAVGLARLGKTAHLVTQTGSDAFGEFARARLAAEGVRVIEAGPDAPASTALATLDDHGRAEYTLNVRWNVTRIPVPADSAAVHVGSLGLILEPGSQEVMHLLAGRLRRGHWLVSLDPNIRADLLGARSAARSRLRRAAALAHIVKLSDEDLDFLFPGSEPHHVRDLLLRGPRRTMLVVVTLGSAGALAATERHQVHVPAFKVPVADTVGAGDAFMSSLLAGLAEENVHSPGGLTELAAAGPEPIGRLVARASAAAAITCGRTGANPPTATELAEFLASH